MSSERCALCRSAPALGDLGVCRRCAISAGVGRDMLTPETSLELEVRAVTDERRRTLAELEIPTPSDAFLDELEATLEQGVADGGRFVERLEVEEP